MARPLRIEYENAWYHVMNRGANHQDIFTTDEHRKIFINLLEEIVRVYAIEIHAYCLMDNHYHLLICTPHANLGRAMRHLSSVYTQRYNLIENKDGALFRGRYKAILIEADEYLLQVNRYIHLNPVSARICSHPQNYFWSSYNAYIDPIKNYNWLTTSYSLEAAGGINSYIEFISDEIDDELQSFYDKKNTSVILGTEKFKLEKLKKMNEKIKIEQAPDIRRAKTLPDIELIINVTANFFHVNLSDLFKSKRKQLNLPRLFAIFLSRLLGIYTYQEIGRHFKISLYAINSAVKRFEKLIEQEEKIKNSLEILINTITDCCSKEKSKL